MIVSTKGRYALHVMLALARRYGTGEYVPLKTVAEDQAIPHKYTENITTALVKAGLVEGSRGKAGGYRLIKPPREYTAYEILQTTETELAAVTCTGKEAAACPKAEKCLTLPMWRALDGAVKDILERYTLADLLNGKQ